MLRGYWATMPYHRLSVSEFVEEFCGWKPLVELVELMPQTWRRERGFIATLFLTGGRVSEVLSLRKENFELRMNEGLIIVRGMPLFKRYRKIKETQSENGKKHWITERLEKTRKPFPILLREPLVPYMVNWIKQSEGLLFPSPYIIGKPLSRFWAYKLIRNLDKAVPNDLRRRLGLDKPFIKDGKRISDRLHLWLH